MTNCGIYLVTLNNIEPISVNSHDKRVAERSIKVTKKNCKIGKATDLEKRKKNYFKTFGESNVNFEVLATTFSVDKIERSILHALDQYRIKGVSGRKNEWLENITLNDLKKIIRKVFEQHSIYIVESFIPNFDSSEFE